MAAARRDLGFEQLPVMGKMLLLFAIMGVTGVVYYLTLHASLASEMDNVEQRSQALQQELSEAKSSHRKYLRLREELVEREKRDERNRRVLPPTAEIPAFLGELNRTAELSGLQIELVQPRPEEPDALVVRVPVALELKGKYHQLVKFFYNVSQLERAVNMENISLTDPAREGEEVRLNAKVLATTFRRRQSSDDRPEDEG